MTTDVARRRMLPLLTREMLAQQNRLCRPRTALALGNGWVLHDRVASPKAGAAWCRLNLTLSGLPASLHCSPALLDAVLGMLPVEPDPSPDLLPLLLELALDTLLDRLDAQVEVLTVDRQAAPPGVEARSLVLDAFGRGWALALSAPIAALDALLRCWPSAPQPCDEVRLAATLRLGTTSLILGVLRSLQAGDAVLLERSGGRRARGRLAVAEHLLAAAEWNGRGWRLEAAPTTNDAEREGWLGKNDMAGHDAPDGEAMREDEIPVTLCFDLGRLEMPLGELRRLGAGSVLELPGPADAPVRLTVGGRCIGTGELVEVEGHAGVRVLRILGRG